MTTADDIATRLRANAAATTRGEYDDLEAAVEAANRRVNADADEAAALIGPLVDVLRAQAGEVSTADALVHDPGLATSVQTSVARLLLDLADARPSLIAAHARDLATAAILVDLPTNDLELALSTVVGEDPAAFAACCDAAAASVDAGGGADRRDAFDLVASVVDANLTWVPSDTATEPTAQYEADADSRPTAPAVVRDAESIEPLVLAAASAFRADDALAAPAARAYAAVARAAPDAAAPAVPWAVHAARSDGGVDRRRALLDALAALAATRPGTLVPSLSTVVDCLTARDETVRERAGDVLERVAYRDQDAVLAVASDIADAATDDGPGTAPAVAALESAATGDAFSPDDLPGAILDSFEAVAARLDSEDATVVQAAAEFVKTAAKADVRIATPTVDRLADVAVSDPGVLADLHAMRALAAIADTDTDQLAVVLEALLDHLDADDAERRVAALEAIESIFEAPSPLSDRSPEAPVHERVLSALVDALGGATHDPAVDALSEAIKRDATARHLVEEDLLDATTATDLEVRVSAYELVRTALYADAEAFPTYEVAIERGLAADDPTVRAAALAAARPVTPDANEMVTALVPAVADCLDDREDGGLAEDAVEDAARLLGNVSDTAPAVVARESDAIVAAYAAAAPSYDPRGPSSVVKHLGEALANVAAVDPTVVAPVTDELAAVGRQLANPAQFGATRAIDALGEAAPTLDAARDALLDVYEHGHDRAATTAAEHLAAAVETTPEATEAVVHGLCERELDVDARVDAVHACAQTRPVAAAPAVPALVDLVTDHSLGDAATVGERALDALAAIAAADESVVGSVVPAVLDVLFETTEPPMATAAIEALDDVATAQPDATRAAMPAAAADTPVDLLALDLDPATDPTSDAIERDLTAPSATTRFQAAFAYHALATTDPDAACSTLDAVVDRVTGEPPVVRLQLYGAVDALAEERPERVAARLPELLDGVLTHGPTPTADDTGVVDDLALVLTDALVAVTYHAPDELDAVVDRLQAGLTAATRGERIQSALYIGILGILHAEHVDAGTLAGPLDRVEPDLRDCLDGTDLDRDVAAVALTILRTALPEAVPILRDLLEAPAHPLAEEAAEALTVVTDATPARLADTDGGVPALLAAAAHADPDVRVEAIDGLATVATATGDARTIQALGDALTDDAAAVRDAAASAFDSPIGRPEPLDPALPGLARALASEDETARTAATNALDWPIDPSDRSLDATALVAAVRSEHDAVTNPALDLLRPVARHRPGDVLAAGIDPLREELAACAPRAARKVLEVVDALADHAPTDLRAFVPALIDHAHREVQAAPGEVVQEPNHLAISILRRIADADPTAVVDAVPTLATVLYDADDVSGAVVDEARDALAGIASDHPDAVEDTVATAVATLETGGLRRQRRALDLLAALVDADVVPIPTTTRTATDLLAASDGEVDAAAARFLDAAIANGHDVDLDAIVPALATATQDTSADRRASATAALATVAHHTSANVPHATVRDRLTDDDHRTAGAAVRCLHAAPDAVALSTTERHAIQNVLAAAADPRTKLAGIDLLAATDTTAATQAPH